MLENLKREKTYVMKVSLPSELPPHREGDSPIIPTIPGAQPVKKPAYKVSPTQNAEIKRQITEYLEKVKCDQHRVLGELQCSWSRNHTAPNGAWFVTGGN